MTLAQLSSAMVFKLASLRSDRAFAETDLDPPFILALKNLLSEVSSLNIQEFELIERVPVLSSLCLPRHKIRKINQRK